MKDAKSIAQSGLVLALLMMSTACVVEPRNDYYDRDQHRYYHDHAWHQCIEQDEHCR